VTKNLTALVILLGQYPGARWYSRGEIDLRAIRELIADRVWVVGIGHRRRLSMVSSYAFCRDKGRMTDTSLDELLRRRITEEGPLRFDAFLDEALYGPFGYYATRVPGRGSDYRTAPSETEWFGRLVLRELESMWRRLGSPEEFMVAEVGPGQGDLAASAIGVAGGAFAKALRWWLVEPFEIIAQLQRHRLSQLLSRLDWVSSLEELDPFVGVVLANEVLDNFPFRLFELTEAEVQEVGVGLLDGELSEVLMPPASPPSPEALDALRNLDPGDRFEVRPGLERWCWEIARVLKTGYLVVIDYGDTEPEIWTRRPAGTLATYHDEQLGFDPLANLGTSDITAHVNFSALERSLRLAGISTAPLISQREWLRTLGLRDVVEELRAAEKAAANRGEHAAWLSFVAERSRVESLGAKGGLGEHKVLLACTPGCSFRG
jgi:SAM-dependent MidA family methyltransferase